jgi:hypothetical protein
MTSCLTGLESAVLTTDNFCFYLQNRLIQTSQTGGQWYSDTPPLVFPAITYLLGASATKNEGSSFQEEITTQNEDKGNETVSSSASFGRKPKRPTDILVDKCSIKRLVDLLSKDIVIAALTKDIREYTDTARLCYSG